ncbi:MAG: epoxyqueuosine reductase [Methanomicrobiaceae archaeon]|nr:epoxyqueuosine reductase [Methanomicrobiaceae archaeon]
MKDQENNSAWITEKLDSYIVGIGAAISGYCDLSGIPDLPFPGLKTGISLGINLNPEIVLSLKKGPGEDYVREYGKVNTRLSELAEKVSGFLIENGYNANYIAPTKKVIDPEKISAEFPHKTAATSAGLGWIGKNALLVTKKYGSAVRIITVFTDAPLISGEPVIKSYCGSCSLCGDICPAGAVSGINWSRGMPGEKLLNIRGCFEYNRKRDNDPDGFGICGVCIAVCPWTDKYLKREGLL